MKDRYLSTLVAVGLGAILVTVVLIALNFFVLPSISALPARSAEIIKEVIPKPLSLSTTYVAPTPLPTLVPVDTTIATVVTPVRSITVNSGQVTIVYITPRREIKGLIYVLNPSAATNYVLNGKVVEVAGPSEIEWYNDETWVPSRVKQVRLNHTDVSLISTKSSR